MGHHRSLHLCIAAAEVGHQPCASLAEMVLVLVVRPPQLVAWSCGGYRIPPIACAWVAHAVVGLALYMHAAIAAAVAVVHMVGVVVCMCSGMDQQNHCRMLAWSFCVHLSDARTDFSLGLVRCIHNLESLEQSYWQRQDICALAVEVVVHQD